MSLAPGERTVPRPGPQVAPRDSLEEGGSPRTSHSSALVQQLTEELTGREEGLGLHPGSVLLGP